MTAHGNQWARRAGMAIVAAVVAVPVWVLGAGASPSDAAVLTACPTGWSTLVQTLGQPGSRSDARGHEAVEVRGRHGRCADAVELDVAPGPTWVSAGYEGAGTSTRLVVSSDAALGRRPGPLGTGMRTVPRVTYVGTDRHRSTVVVSTRARLPFHLRTEPAPNGRTRIVVEVAHPQ